MLKTLNLDFPLLLVSGEFQYHLVSRIDFDEFKNGAYYVGFHLDTVSEFHGELTGSYVSPPQDDEDDPFLESGNDEVGQSHREFDDWETFVDSQFELWPKYGAYSYFENLESAELNFTQLSQVGREISQIDLTVEVGALGARASQLMTLDSEGSRQLLSRWANLRMKPDYYLELLMARRMRTLIEQRDQYRRFLNDLRMNSEALARRGAYWENFDDMTRKDFEELRKELFFGREDSENREIFAKNRQRSIDIGVQREIEALENVEFGISGIFEEQLWARYKSVINWTKPFDEGPSHISEISRKFEKTFLTMGNQVYEHSGQGWKRVSTIPFRSQPDFGTHYERLDDEEAQRFFELNFG